MNTKTLILSAGLTPVLAAMSGAAPQAEIQTVIYSEIVTHSSSIVAGLPGVPIDFIDRPFFSPDGNHWILTVSVNTGSSLDDELVIVDGAIVAREGTTPAYLPTGRIHGFFDQKLGILNSGAYIFSGGLNGPGFYDDYVAVADALGNISLLVQDGSQLPGAPVGWLAGMVDSAVITNAGVGFSTDGVSGPSFGMDDLMMLNGSIFLQSQVDAPAGQFSGLSETWQDFDIGDFFVSSDSSNYMLQGNLHGNSLEDNVVVVNGAVVVQEGYALLGGNPTDIVDTSGIAEIHMNDSGNWMARGDFDVTNEGWAIYNGALIGNAGGQIIGGSVRTMACNGVGDHVVVASSNAPVGTIRVLVLNETEVVAREGDPVDLDGNGVFDDDTFYWNFGTGDLYLSDDLLLHLVVGLKNGAGTIVGDCFMSLDLKHPAGTTFCDPAVPNSTGLSTVLMGEFGSGVGSDLHLEVTQGVPGELAYFLAGNEATSGMIISNGLNCLIGTGTAQMFRYNVSGGASNSVGRFDGSGVFQNLAGTSGAGSGFDVPDTIPGSMPILILSGATWHFQVWHRDRAVLTSDSNFSNGLSVTF